LKLKDFYQKFGKEYHAEGEDRENKTLEKE
jgi:hypothetical protein